MAYWSGVTRNLIMQNSAPVRQHGGDLGSTTWSYVVGNDGVKTIDPIVGFYLSPPSNASCRWSTNNGLYPPNHIVIGDGDGNEDAMPPRELVDWNDNIIQAKVEQYRHQYCADLKYLVRPNTFEDLYKLFDSATLWINGAYNLWKLVNALVTLAHDQFPYILQDWKDHIEKVVCNVFRPATDDRLTRGIPNKNMQVLHNQKILTEWDRQVDPLTLLQHTTFPVGDLPLMSLQQHGLLRELLICEHIRLTGTQSPIPQYYNFTRPVVSTAPAPPPACVDSQAQHTRINNAIQHGSSDSTLQDTRINTPAQKSECRIPLVVVGTSGPGGQAKDQPMSVSTFSNYPITSATAAQSSVQISPSPAFLPRVIDENGTTKTGETTNFAAGEAETCLAPLNIETMPPDAMTSSFMSVTSNATLPIGTKPTEDESKVESPTPKPVAMEVMPRAEASSTKFEMRTPLVITKGATPAPSSPIRDLRDSNGSIAKLFFPDAPFERIHMRCDRSIASAPDQDTEPMPTIAEKQDGITSETPSVTQVEFEQQQQQHKSYSACDVSVPNDPTSLGSLRFPVPGRSQGRHQSEPSGYQIQYVPQNGRPLEASATASSTGLSHFGPPNGLMQGSGPFNPGPPSFQAGHDGFFPHYGPPPHPSNAMPMGQSMGPPMEPPMGSQTRPSMGSRFQEQMLLHADPQFGPHGSPTNAPHQWSPSYQPNGYIYQHQHHGSHGEQGDNGYSSNGYRNSNSNSGFNNQYNRKRRDSIQFTGPRKPRMHSIPGAVTSVPLQAGTGFSGRRPSNVCRSDQNRGKPDVSNCKNEKGLPYEALFNTHFVECSCGRCQENSRSVFVVFGPQGRKSDDDLQDAFLKHFAQFNPVVARVRRASVRPNCLIEFRNDVDIAQIIHWSCDPQNQAVSGVIDRVQTWYPLYSKHYIPRRRYAGQDRYQSHEFHEHNRREWNSFRNQTPVDNLGMNDCYNGPGTLQQNFPRLSFNGPMSAPSFPPTNGMIYQKVLPQNQSRVLFNPNAPQRRDSKVQNPEPSTARNEQQLVLTIGPSQDVRRSGVISDDSWRQSQTKSPFEHVTMEKGGDAADAKNTSSKHSLKSAKVSSSEEENSVRELDSLAASRSVSPEGNDRMKEKVQLDQPEKGRPLIKWSRREQHRNNKPNKNKPYKNKLRKEHMPTDDPKATDKSGEKSLASSKDVTPDAMKHNANADELNTADKADGKSAASSRALTPEATKPVQQESAAIDEHVSAAGNGEKSIASSRTITPEGKDLIQKETTTPHKNSPSENNAIARKKAVKSQSKKSSKKAEQINVSEQQTVYRKTAAELAMPRESMEAETTKNDTVTGGYRKTTDQLSSAVEDVGYSMDTVIRHKPGRPVIPTEWVDAEADDKLLPDVPSTTEGTQTVSAILNRLSDVNRHMTVYHLKSIPAQDFLQDLMSSGVGTATGGALVSKEASASSAALVPTESNAINDGPETVVTESVVEIRQKPNPFRGQKNNKKKMRRALGAGSNLALQSNTPTETQSRGISPALEQPSTLKSTNNNNYRVALPKGALPLPQVAPSTQPSGDSASVAKTGVCHVPQADRKDSSDPFAAGRNQNVLGDFIKDKNVKSPQNTKLNNKKENVSSGEASPTPSPEKKSRHQNTTRKSQMSTAVQPFDLSGPYISPPTSTKPRLNPNAAAFSLPSSPSPSVVNTVGSGHNPTHRNITVMHKKKDEKPGAAHRVVPAVEIGLIKKGHAKKASLPGQTMSLDKRFVTPAEQVLDAAKMMQPPPPSKKTQRVGCIPCRTRGTDESTMPTTNPRRTTADSFIAEPKKEAATVVNTENFKEIKTAPKANDQIIGDISAKAHVTPAKSVHESHPESESQTLNNESFPRLDQAGAAIAAKKGRAATISKTDLPAIITSAPAFGAVLGKEISASSQTSCPSQSQQSGAKNKLTQAQRTFAASAPTVAKAQPLKAEQKQKDTQAVEMEPPADKNAWQIVAPKQKTHVSANKSHGGRSVKSNKSRGGSGRRDGATEERDDGCET